MDARFEGIAVACTRVPRGFDLAALLRGLPDHLCPCPHWGYVVSGRMLVRYADGSEEEIKGGDAYSARAGHTAVIGEDTVSVDFSPVGPWREPMEHTAATMKAV